MRCPTETKRKLLYKYLNYFLNDNLYNLAYEMDTAYIESEIWIPFLDEFFKEIGFESNVTKDVLIKAHQKRWVAFTLLFDEDSNREDIASIYNTFDHSSYMISYIQRIFNKSSDLHNRFLKPDQTPNSIIELIREGDISTQSLTENSPILNFLYEQKGWLGPQEILMLHEINLQLKEKYKNINENLESMLKI